MEPIVVQCHGCNVRLKVPAAAVGKSVKCQKCGQIVAVPVVAEAAPDTLNSSAQMPAGQTPGASQSGVPPQAVPNPQVAQMAAASAVATKTCPYCGEMILMNAVKCKHCGEFLNQQPMAKPAPTHSTHEMNPAEYIVATVFAPVGIVFGIIWLIMGIPKGKKMLPISILCCVIAFSGVLIARHFIFNEEPESEGGAPATHDFNIDGPFFPPDDSSPTTRREEADLQGEIDIEGQPPEIQRALRANVRIETFEGLGSGVVIRRDGDMAIIVTNRHVIDPSYAVTRGRTQISIDALNRSTVTYLSKEEEVGEVVWLAPDGIDLAIVKAKCPDSIEPQPWDNESQTITGAEVFAIGNPAGLGWTYTRGVVSALRRRSYGSYEVPIIQTDASIAGGSSGGGLYDKAGKLIGINTFIVDPSQAGGLGFAIRIEMLKELAPEILLGESEDSAD